MGLLKVLFLDENLESSLENKCQEVGFMLDFKEMPFMGKLLMNK